MTKQNKIAQQHNEILLILLFLFCLDRDRSFSQMYVHIHSLYAGVDVRISF